MLDLGIYIIISALVGAKLLLLITDFRTFSRNPRELLTLARSGGVFYGGLILAVAVALWYIRRAGLPLWTTCDVFAPGIALGHVVGRFGCLFAGCCYGKPTTCRGASRSRIRLPQPTSARRSACRSTRHSSTKRAPSSLILGAAAARPNGRGRTFAGRTFWLYMLLYAISRFVIEFFRGDERGTIGIFSTSQFISLLLAPLAHRDARSRSHAGLNRSRGTCAARREIGVPTIVRQTLTVPEDADGTRLDRFLTSVLGDQSRSRLQQLIRDGHILVAGAAARPNQPVKRGQTISIDIPEPVDAAPVPEALPLRIVYQDADVVVVDKPAGMVVHPAAGHESGTLVNALLHYVDDLSGIGGEKRPGIVHRLDRGTSGLMVAAKNDASHAELARQFHDREVEKEYVALVWGEVMAGRRIDAPIGRDPANRKKMSARARRSREAVTRIVKAEHFGRHVTLAHVAIHTGRTHQIRVHLSAIGHPIVGDALYGGVHRRVPGDLRAITHLDRPFLHAARLVFNHPVDGRRMEFISELPDDLQAVLNELREAKAR